MPTDLSPLPPETQTVLRSFDDKMMLELKWAMAHSLLAHPEHAPVVPSTGLCEDGVMIVCGTKLYTRILALQQEAQTIYSAAMAEVVLAKVAGKS